MKSAIFAIALAGALMWGWTLHQEIASLQDMVSDLRDVKVPTIILKGDYPNVWVEHGEIIVKGGKGDDYDKDKGDTISEESVRQRSGNSRRN